MQNNPARKNPQKLGIILGDNLRHLKLPRVTKIVTENNGGYGDTVTFGCHWTAVGEMVRAARLHAELSQAMLGKAIGSNAANICRIEGGRQTPDLITLDRIADACGVRFQVGTGSE